MHKNKKLLNDTTLYAFAHFSSQAVVFFMLPIYTAYFSPSEFGTWDIILTSATLLVPFITFELTSATYRWLIDPATPYSQETIISTGFFQLVKNTLISNTFAIIILPFIPFSLKWQTLAFINVLIFTSLLNQIARGLMRSKLFAIQGLIQAILVATINLFFILYLKIGIEAFLYTQIIAGVITGSLVCWRLRFFSLIKIPLNEKKLRRNFLNYALPIIPATASWWLMTMADRWMIAGFLGLEQNGIYTIASKIPAVLIMINTVFSLAWKDSAITHFQAKDKNDYYTKIFRHYFRLIASTVICLILLAKPVIENFIGAAYVDAWKYSGILLIAALFHALSLFWAAGFHGAKITKALLTTTLIGASLNIALNFLLIPQLGLYAVAIATACAFLTTWIMRIFMAKSFFKITLPWRDIYIFGALILSGIPLPFLLGKITLYISIALSIILLTIVNRQLTRKVIHQLLNK